MQGIFSVFCWLAILCMAGPGAAGEPLARDCSDIACTRSGVYLLHPGLGHSTPGYCDMETDGGGWTVFQRRDNIQPRVNFSVGWDHYRWGLGLLDGEFWWGNEKVFLMTGVHRDRQYALRIDMEDWEGNRRYALYQGFRLSSAGDNYRLTVVNYTGNAGDSFSYHSGGAFSARDRDNDEHATVNCAQKFKGGWWHKECHKSNLNGLNYPAGPHKAFADGIEWDAWKGYYYSLKRVEMKIRPTKKLSAGDVCHKP